MAAPSPPTIPAHRANRKALPTLTGRGDLDNEIKVFDLFRTESLREQGDYESEKHLGGTIADVVGDGFDMGGAGCKVMRFCHREAEEDLALQRDEIQRWAEAGWPKRVVFALAAVGAVSRRADTTATVHALLRHDSDVKMLVGPDMQPNGEQGVIYFWDPSVEGLPEGIKNTEEYGWAEEDFEGEGPDPRLEPGAYRVYNAVVTASPDDLSRVQDPEFSLHASASLPGNRRSQMRPLVLQRGSCNDYDAPCKQASCPRARWALWNFVGIYTGWTSNDTITPDQDLDEHNDEYVAEWNTLARRAFQETKPLHPCLNRVAVRVDVTGYGDGDNSGVYLCLPLPEACAAGDFEIGVISISVTTD